MDELPTSVPSPRGSNGFMDEEEVMRQALDGKLDIGDLKADPNTIQHADDAVDYEDIGDDDDDLAEEEDSAQAEPGKSFATTQTDQSQSLDLSFAVNGEIGGDGAEGDGDGGGDNDFEYLFDEAPSSPGPPAAKDAPPMDFDENELFGTSEAADTTDAAQAKAPAQSIEEDQQPPSAQARSEADADQGGEEDDEDVSEDDAAGDEMWQLQMRLLKAAKGRWDGDRDEGMEMEAPAPAESQEELVAQMFPTFERGRTLQFTELLPSVKARYVGKLPLKPPKPVLPSKISLNIQHDDEKDFKLLNGGHKRTITSTRNNPGPRLVPILAKADDVGEKKDEVDEESDFENETVGGFSWEDFQVVCGDWEVPGVEDTPDLQMDTGPNSENDDDLFSDLIPEEDWVSGRPSAKRRKLEHQSQDILHTLPHYEFPSLHDPEKATARIAKAVVLDLNDPHLLVEDAEPESSTEQENIEPSTEGFGDRHLQVKAKRYNIANDHEYELLKENHQSKSRNTIGNLTVHHSMPALRLQWPYYKTMLEKTESRSFHRPAGYFPKMETISFKQPRVVKKKHIRNQEPMAIFNKTIDLSLGDNSHVLLLEYSEQYPLVMSNFGMNSRLINYYRRKDAHDTHRPKLEVGELAVLQPQDVSPLTIFGHIDPGEVTPALYNGMFKAPLYEQESKSTDFVMVRNATGVDGSNWYLRNVEYTRVVGQQFPSIEIPGPNARKVTTAAKNRLKMVSYRLLRRRKPSRIQVSEITPHILDPNGGPSNDMQNRQKLKEFMRFNKEHKEWEMPDGAPVPDEDSVRNLVTPEDVCLLEAMQVGQQQLKDAGYAQGVPKDEDAPEEEDEDGAAQTLEELLVPWQLTKNFIQASNNKAMLQLHGEGDPTKRGEAISMLKTSMKGGFKAEGESLNEKMDAQKLKELGGHSYNVAKQQEEYNRTVRKIWEKQKQALASSIEPDIDPGDDEEEEEDDPVLQSMMDGPDVQTMRQQASFRQPHDDESVSQFSRRSMTSQPQQVLKIVRRIRSRTGEEEERVEYVRDHRVIAQYLALRRARDEQNIDLNNLSEEQLKNPTVLRAVNKEIARLERNKDRRLGREKQRASGVGIADPGSPSTPSAAAVAVAAAAGGANGSSSGPGSGTGTPSGRGKGKGNTGGTGRKCAICGQLGHIKTNKKLCPMLNGQMRQEDTFREQEFSVSMANL